MLDPGKPWRNAVNESFDDKPRDECLSLAWFRSRAEARVIIESYRQRYNAVRPDSSLDRLTPIVLSQRSTHPPDSTISRQLPGRWRSGGSRGRCA